MIFLDIVWQSSMHRHESLPLLFPELLHGYLFFKLCFQTLVSRLLIRNLHLSHHLGSHTILN